MAYSQSLHNPFSPTQAQAMNNVPGMYMPYNSPAPGQFNQHNPDWATELMTSVNQIKTDVKKLHDIDNTVNMINLKVTQLETKVNSMETKVADVEVSCSFLSSQRDAFQREIDSTKTEVNKIKQEFNVLSESTSKLQTDKKKLESKVTDLEWRSMRENLVFFGIKEQADETGDCTAIVKEFCETRLQMANATNMMIDRAHRLGKARPGATRPIVAKFHKFETKEDIKKKSFEHKDALKAINVNVRDQWPREVMDKRRQLYPIMEQERVKGKTVRMVRDKLFINNVEYVAE
jgi:chromosome segregation ATPase